VKITIRDAAVSDGADVISLFHDLAGEAGSASALTASYYEAYLRSANSRLLIAEMDGQFSGLLSYSLRMDLWHAAPCCYIEEVGVRREYRGKGIGTELLRHILRKAKEEGYAELSLTVDIGNVRAQALYRRMGIDEETVSLEKHLR
jgi:ribosomal protein S18 acetylase RimI-like enzyme